MSDASPFRIFSLVQATNANNNALAPHVSRTISNPTMSLLVIPEGDYEALPPDARAGAVVIGFEMHLDRREPYFLYSGTKVTDSTYNNPTVSLQLQNACSMTTVSLLELTAQNGSKFEAYQAGKLKWWSFPPEVSAVIAKYARKLRPETPVFPPREKEPEPEQEPDTTPGVSVETITTEQKLLALDRYKRMMSYCSDLYSACQKIEEKEDEAYEKAAAKAKESLRQKHGLPEGLYWSGEEESARIPKREITQLRPWLAKWVKGSLTAEECDSLLYHIDEWMDLDYGYLFFGAPLQQLEGDECDRILDFGCRLRGHNKFYNGSVLLTKE